jgi:iron complex outermembrane recepter protein
VFNHNFGRAGDMTLSVDYFTIEIEDLIDTVGRQTTVDFCFNTPPSNFPNQYCPFLTRDTRGAAFQQGELTEVNSGYINEGTLETEGVDLAVTWGWDLNTLGQLGVRLNYTRLLDFTQTKFGVVDDITGEVGLAEDKAQLGTTWNLGPWMANWEVSYTGDSTVDQSNPLFNFKVGTYTVHDLQVSYSFAESRWAETTMGGARIYLGVNNVLDEDAPIILSGIPGNTTGTDTNASVYSPIGRAWYAGISFRL